MRSFFYNLINDGEVGLLGVEEASAESSQLLADVSQIVETSKQLLQTVTIGVGTCSVVSPVCELIQVYLLFEPIPPMIAIAADISSVLKSDFFLPKIESTWEFLLFL